MSALETMLTLRPLLLRRLLLALFAGPILVVAMVMHGLGLAECRVEALCASFEASWLDRPMQIPA